MIILKTFLLVLLPATGSLFLIDRLSPSQPRRQFYPQLIAAGLISIIPASLLVSLLTTSLNRFSLFYYFIPYLGPAFVEESIKLFVIYLILYRSRELAPLHLALPYSLVIVLAFSSGENFLYMTGSSSNLSLLIYRSLETLPLHLLCATWQAICLIRSRIEEKNYFPQALLLSIFFHGTYNLLLRLPNPLPLLSSFYLLPLFYFLRVKWNKLVEKKS